MASIYKRLSSNNNVIINAPATDVNVISNVLPTGASTFAGQSTQSNKLDTLIAKDYATETTLAALDAKVTAVNTGAVVVSSSALPTGASTEATLSALNAKVTAVNTGAVIVSSSALPSGAATESSLSSIKNAFDIETRAALGLVPGMSTVNKFGRNIDLDTGSVPESMWGGGGLYTGFPSSGSAETLQIFSSNVNDTDGGSGARTVMVIGLDADYNVISETVTLNGTTPVTTVATFWRVHTANVRSSGGTPANTNFNLGTITVRHSTTTANVFLVMQIGTNQTNNAGYTVPAGHTAVVRRIHGSVRGLTSGSIDISLWVRQFGLSPRLRRPSELSSGTELDDSLWGGLVLPEKSDIHIQITSVSTNNLEATGGYDLILIDNSYL